MRGDNNYRRFPAPAGVLGNRTQRWAVQMIKVRVGHQNDIGSGQVANLNSGLSQTLQHEKPARKVRIDDDVLAAYLQEKTGVPDEGDAHLSVTDQCWFVSLARSRAYGGVSHQPPECASAFTKSRIFQARF